MLCRAFIDNTNLQKLTLNDNEQFSEMPAHLFYGNPNLVELSMRNNRLSKLDAVQLPLDQLKKLSLADNPLVCNCSLIWLWQLIKWQQGLTIDEHRIGCNILIADSSNRVQVIRKRLKDLTESDISCPTHIVTIISVILTVIFIAVICVSILVAIKCSRNAQLRRRQQKFLASDNRHVDELIIPQKVDKFELERYMTGQHEHKPQIQQQYPMHNLSQHPSIQNQYFHQQNPDWKTTEMETHENFIYHAIKVS